MLVTSVKYTIRRVLAQYEHEELSIEISNSEDNPSTPDEMFQEARRACISNTTAHLKSKQKSEEENG